MIVFKNVLRRIVRLPSHATVVAYLAFFMATGGTAYAAVQWTSADIADGSLSGTDIQDNSLTGADITAGSITSADLAPGTLETGGSSSPGILLGSASNPDILTGPLYGTDPAVAAVTIAEITFDVPAGEHHQVLIAAQGVVAQTGGYCPSGQLGAPPSVTTWFGGFGVALDKTYDRPLLGFLSGNLPEFSAPATGGSQTLVVGEGTHTVELVIAPNTCTTPGFTPGSVSVSDSYLSVSLLAGF